ncbi:hypothetical protein [Kitasatospora purpeofusca]|uniref:hypothetical protein n=1 Tax=Kitasatospora purpeofusca TaxID=67352 RepID=UPI00386F0256|nr:hypothetical protein OIP63_38990 [Kitasatospora purpeofusca]
MFRQDGRHAHTVGVHRRSLQQRLTEHARTAWPQLTDLNIRHCGQFAYVGGELADGEAVKLMRLRYSGTASRWGFAPYDASSDRYEDSLLPTSTFTGSPEDTLDCACQLHLAGPELCLPQH